MNKKKKYAEDRAFGKAIQKGLKGPRVSESKIRKILNPAEDAALIQLMDAIPNSPTVDREKIFKTLKRKR